MVPPRGLASYRKQDGVLAISKDRKAVSWSPAQPPDASPVLVISASNITNLQQTPESSPRVMLKIFVQEAGKPEAVAHVFQFTSQVDARNEANAIKETLASIIQAQKAASATNDSVGGHSAAMTIANAISGGTQAGNIWEDDEKLLNNIELQKSLMKDDAELQKTFIEALKTKQNEISTSQFTKQFWSSRVAQLRAHAIAQSQGRGRYNVLAQLKKEDGGTKMTITQEHVRVIFDQYPAMRLIYDEVVPAKIKSEVDFWSRFFQSQLHTTLRGLKVDRSKDAKDAVLDQYLDHPEITGARSTSAELHIPRFIDLEGNEEHHSQRKGNRPNIDMRPSGADKAPIMRRLNELSSKLMSSVKPSDTDASAPIGIDEETFNQLRLQDLAGDPEENRIILNIRDQSRFFSDNRTAQEEQLHKIDPATALQQVCSNLNTSFPQPGTVTLPIEYESDDEEPDEDSSTKDVPNAASHIISLVRANRDQTAPIPSTSGLSPTIYDRLTLTHATTLEFLRQFWSAFLSGDPSRAADIENLVKTLDNALLRVSSIAEDAEKERNDKIKEAQMKSDEIARTTGRRRRVDFDAIGGGEKVVRELLGPLEKSVKIAQGKFKVAYLEQSGIGGQ